ncbi:acetyltransferase [Flocculibacter collagenilyticus]|uniref:acetyltransferase n=1 Tax=Flocculibacter collagenilyticus TaxID=2744479 RepID=UPI0018F55338|nr:acetyltransferase [Flocculibacter collagenilyticus]
MRLAIVGAGGHGKVAGEIAEQNGWDVYFFDYNYPELKACGTWPVIGNDDELLSYKERFKHVFIAIGDNKLRKQKSEQFIQAGFEVISLISKHAYVSQYATIEQGALVVAKACINPYVTIGEGVIINTGATVDHDCNIESFCHISPGVNLAGGVTISTLSWVGIGATIIQNVFVGKGVIVGAGATVIDSVKPYQTVVGCPAVSISNKNS